MPRILDGLSRLTDAVRSFAGHRGGNVAIIVAFSMIPIVGLVGLGTDYGVALTDKSKLDNAADAAAVAAVATAKAFVAANQGDATLFADAVTAGLNQAARALTVNTGNLPFAPVPTPTTSPSTAPATNTCGQASACIYLTQSGQTFTSTVYYRTYTQNHFGQIFGSPTMNLYGTAAATTQIPSYLDFYLLLDVSGSMGLPTTSAGMAALAKSNHDMYSDYQQGCQFACHFPTFTGWGLAQGSIQLRSDAVNNAVCSLLQKAANPSVPNQYRVGIYPFINQMATLSALSANISSLSIAMQCSSSWPLALTNLLDTGTTQLATGGDPSTGTGSGGTHFEVVFPQVQSTITSFGTGSSSTNSKPFVFLVTDGMENNQHFYLWKNKYTYPGNPTMTQGASASSYAGYSSAWWDGSQPSQIDPTVCAALKAKATVSILYIPYNIISFVNNSGGIAWENNQVNGFSPTLGNALQQCATTGFFYTANSPSDITNALNAMFNQALQVAHLTQ